MEGCRIEVNNVKTEIEFNCKKKDVLLYAAMAVHGVYMALLDEDAECGECFKELIACEDSPVWIKGISDVQSLNDKDFDNLKDAFKKMDGILAELDAMLEQIKKREE